MRLPHLAAHSVLFLMFLWCAAFPLSAASGFCDQADRLFQHGDLAGLRGLLDAAKPVGEDDQACLDFYRAKLTPDAPAAAERFRRAANSTSRYGEWAVCELAAWYTLIHHDADAMALLRDHSSSNAAFWRARIAYNLGQPATVTEAGNACLNGGVDSTQAALTRFVMAEARYGQKDYRGGISILQVVQRGNASQLGLLATLRMGYGYSCLGDLNSARECYRQVMRSAPNTAYYFQADENVRSLGQSTVPEQIVSNPRPVKPAPTAHKPAPQGKKGVEKMDNQPVKQPAGSKIYLQIGVFGNKANAKKIERDLRALGYKVVSFDKTVQGQTCRVVTVGPYASEAKAGDAQNSLRKKNIESKLVYR